MAAARMLILALLTLPTGMAGDVAAGKEAYVPCSACHGEQGEGSRVLNAPAIGGQESWYIERQLKNFRDGIRGSDIQRDPLGGRMAAMTNALATDEQITDVAAYLATLRPEVPPVEVVGDLDAGATTYQTCAACHGQDAEGNASLNAPKLYNQHDWYLRRQLVNFRSGVRGADPRDTHGTVMKAMATSLTGTAQKDVVAFIASKAPTRVSEDVGGDVLSGKASYAVCAACHGQHGEGSKAYNAPAIAGQERWYLERQLRNFRAGVRGGDTTDTYGRRMAVMSLALTEEEITTVAAFVASLEPPTPPPTLQGEADAGKGLYTVCAQCHGEQGEGNAKMNTPRLKHQHDWYLKRQIVNFKMGLRGAHPSDTHGQVMPPVASTLADQGEVRDVVAYIMSL